MSDVPGLGRLVILAAARRFPTGRNNGVGLGFGGDKRSLDFARDDGRTVWHCPGRMRFVASDFSTSDHSLLVESARGALGDGSGCRAVITEALPRSCIATPFSTTRGRGRRWSADSLSPSADVPLKANIRTHVL